MGPYKAHSAFTCMRSFMFIFAASNCLHNQNTIVYFMRMRGYPFSVNNTLPIASVHGVRVNKHGSCMLFALCIYDTQGERALLLFLKCLQEEKEHRGHDTLAKMLLDECSKGTCMCACASNSLARQAESHIAWRKRFKLKYQCRRNLFLDCLVQMSVK